MKIIYLFVVSNKGKKLVLRQAKPFFRDHKHSLTLLLQQVVKGYSLFISLSFLSQETLFYNSDLFHLAYRIKLAFKFRNMENTLGKNGGTKNVTIDCSSSTFTA